MARFNAAQKDVLKSSSPPGGPPSLPPPRPPFHGEAHDAAVRVLTQGLVDLKLLAGDLDNLIERATTALLHAPHRPLARAGRA